jgi:hypothetical protein
MRTLVRTLMGSGSLLTGKGRVGRARRYSLGRSASTEGSTTTRGVALATRLRTLLWGEEANGLGSNFLHTGPEFASHFADHRASGGASRAIRGGRSVARPFLRRHYKQIKAGAEIGLRS